MQEHSQKSLMVSLLELCKPRITIAVTITTAVGWLLYEPSFSLRMLLPCFALFMVACGSAALNQWQERELDALMDRTRQRPIPSGRVSSSLAFVFALGLAGAGSGILYVNCGLSEAILSLLALIWYNGFYTPLKRVSPYAVVPGGVIGSIPPLVGWAAAGGSLMNPMILAFAFFIFMWQVPHFWLLAMGIHRDYDSGGFPTMQNQFSPDQMGRIVYSWIVATAVTPFLVLRYGQFSEMMIGSALLVMGVLLCLKEFSIVFGQWSPRQCKMAFMRINLYALLVMVIFVADRLVS